MTNPTVTIVPHDTTPGKLAEAELQFTDGPLAGLRLTHFGIWRHAVTFPHTYGFIDSHARVRISDLLLDAYAAVEGLAELAAVR